ncbi:glycoprotease [Ruminococcaceae bacterium OttesenSCG-928-I18]|nr:glycoprotease [Ruminococcaceae bacterium OttesenSCG-928-I18]
MVVLGVDTSNYATSVAVVDTGRREVVCAKKQPLSVPEGQAGLRQSDALFQHTVALPGLFAEMEKEGVLQGIEAVSVSEKPRPQECSYMPCFLAGVNAAAAVSAGLGCPLSRTTHQQGHLAAAMFASGRVDLYGEEEFFIFHFSGGTTELLRARGFSRVEVIGESLDLYAGQAVDRLGLRLGFPFPAGEKVSHLAAQCAEPVVPKLSMQGGNCHLSGLQNQCETLLKKGKDPAYVAKYCLLAIAGTALEMLAFARNTYGPLPVLCAGGVMGSRLIQTHMRQRAEDVHFVPPAYSSDNAVGVAFIAEGEAPHA